MPTPGEQIDRFISNEPRLDQIVNGDEDTDVQLSNGGIVPSLKKLFKSMTTKIAAQQVQQETATASANAAKGYRDQSAASASTVATLLASTGLTRYFSTLAAAKSAGLTVPAQIFILSDARLNGRATMGAFDGWEFRLQAGDGGLTWAPGDLFGNGEKGAVYDFTDPNSMFQDRAATIPVTADNQPVAIVLDRSGLRPVPFPARVNLLSGTESAFSNQAQALNVVVEPFDLTGNNPKSADGSSVAKITETTANNIHGVYYRAPIPAAGTYTYQVAINPSLGRKRFMLALTAGQMVAFDLNAMTATVTGSQIVRGIISGPDAAGLITIAMVFTLSAADNNRELQLLILNDNGDLSYQGDTTKGCYFAQRQVSAGNGIVPYQRIGAAAMGHIQPNILSTNTDAQRPLYRQGSKRFLSFDGVANSLIAEAVDVRSPTGVTTMALAFDILDSKVSAVMSHDEPGDMLSVPGAREIVPNNPVFGSVQGFFGASGVSQGQFETYDGARVPRTTVVIVEFNRQAATAADRIKITVNGLTAALENPSGNPSLPATASSSMARLVFGSRLGTAFFAATNLYGGLILNRALTAAEKTLVSNYLASKAALSFAPATLPFSDTPTAYLDTHANPTTPGVFPGGGTPATFSRVVYDTTAEWIRLTSVGTNYNGGANLGESELGIYIDGQHYASYRPGKAGTVTSGPIALPPGRKKLEIVNSSGTSRGFISNPPVGNLWLGNYLTKIEADASLTPLVPATTPAERWVVYGDSISVGTTDDPPTKFAWTMLFRNYLRKGDPVSTTASLGSEGHGTRTLYQDTATADLRAAFVQRFVRWNPTKLYSAIGTNDYSSSLYSASEFQAAFGLLLDDLHTALPNMQIFLQSMIYRGDVTGVNQKGSVLDDYRSALQTLASSRSSYVKFIDGTGIVAPSDLNADRLHPTNAGNLVYWNAVKAKLQTLGALT